MVGVGIRTLVVFEMEIEFNSAINRTFSSLEAVGKCYEHSILCVLPVNCEFGWHGLGGLSERGGSAIFATRKTRLA
jgi:hypothetical protein